MGSGRKLQVIQYDICAVNDGYYASQRFLRLFTPVCIKTTPNQTFVEK